MKVTWLDSQNKSDRRQWDWKTDWRSMKDLHICRRMQNDGYDDDTNNDDDNIKFTIDTKCELDRTSITSTTFIDDDNQDESDSLPMAVDKKTILSKEDFFSDTPYYKSFIDKEMHALGIRVSTMKDVGEKTKAFGKIGLQMAEAARKLSLSCRLGPETDMNPNSVQARKDALGPEMISALERLGEVLDEIASAQEFMCKHFETSVATHLESFAADATEISNIRKEESMQTEEAERVFFQYINGKNAGGNFRENSGTTRNLRQEVEVPESEKDLKIAHWNHDLQHIGVKQASAELKRFQLARKIVYTKFGHNSELSSGLSNILSEMRTYFSYSYDLVAGITSNVKEVEDKNHKLQGEHKISDSFTWQECEDNLLDGLSSMKWAHSITERGVERASKLARRKGIHKKKPAATSKSFDLSKMEIRSKIWDLPSTLASFSKFYRTTPPAVLLEGWLYRRTNSYLPSNAWSRARFILKRDGVYCLRQRSELRRKLKINSVAEEKVCDIELCTVRELPDNDPSARFRFELVVSGDNREVMLLQARGPCELLMWVEGIRSAISQHLFAGNVITRSQYDESSYSGSEGQWLPFSHGERRASLGSEIGCAVLETEGPTLRSNSFDDVSAITESDDDGSLTGEESKVIAQKDFIGDPGEAHDLTEKSYLEDESEYHSDLEYFL